MYKLYNPMREGNQLQGYSSGICLIAVCRAALYRKGWIEQDDEEQRFRIQDAALQRGTGAAVRCMQYLRGRTRANASQPTT